MSQFYVTGPCVKYATNNCHHTRRPSVAQLIKQCSALYEKPKASLLDPFSSYKRSKQLHTLLTSDPL